MYDVCLGVIERDTVNRYRTSIYPGILCLLIHKLSMCVCMFLAFHFYLCFILFLKFVWCYWSSFGVDLPNLKKLAFRIINKHVVCYWHERNYSVFKQIHFKQRNILEYKRFNYAFPPSIIQPSPKSLEVYL